MKLSSATILVAASALFAACNSLDNPFSSWFHAHGDARVYNPQTGQWEYPNQKTTPKPQKSAAVASALNTTPAPQGGGDGRVFDAQKNQWVEVHNPPASADPAAPKVTPAPPAPGAPANGPATVAVSSAPSPAAPRPNRATGIYNSSTGRIEWQSGEAPPPPVAPRPAPVKHWWWPF